MIAVTICAVGRLRASPELELIQDYCARATKTGKAYGVGPVEIVEVEDKKARGMSAEADLLRAAIPDNAVVCALDERGKTLSSPDFTTKVAGYRDDGHRNLAFIIGGADGIDPTLRASADFSVSFGKLVWPHMLARVMLCEQIYRATTILAGSPYHRV